MITSNVFNKKIFSKISINDGIQNAKHFGDNYEHSLEKRAKEYNITVEKLIYLIQKGIDSISFMHTINPNKFPKSKNEIVVICSVSKVKLLFFVDFEDMFCRFKTLIPVNKPNYKDDLVITLTEARKLFGENYKDFTLHVFNNENNEPQFKIDNDKIIELNIKE